MTDISKFMTIIAIDPGPTQSAYVLLNGEGRPYEFAKLSNADMAAAIKAPIWSDAQLVIEMIASYGMPVGAEVFETCVWIGRFMQAFDQEAMTFRLTRNYIKIHLCGSSKAKDSNIRQALIDRYGGKNAAIGKKAAPGPLYGMAGDCWAALAVAVTWADGGRV